MRLLLASLLLLLPILAKTQDRLPPGDKRFAFQPGLYFTIEDYKANHANVKLEQLCDKSGKRIFDLDINSGTIYYLEGSEVKSFRGDHLFGYCYKNSYYVRLEYNQVSYFARLVVIGSLSHFVCEVKTHISDPYSPMNSRTSYSLVQFILDYETGRIAPFSQDNFEYFLTKDQDLNLEYQALSKKKKRDLMFLYLRKYNEKHPITFPIQL